MPDLAEILERLLDARRRLREHFAVLHRKLLDLARGDEVCRRLMTIPGVGPVSQTACRMISAGK
jgi:transposase